jgi:hypothetical protein
MRRFTIMTYYKAKQEVRFYAPRNGHLCYRGFVPEEALLTLKEYRNLICSETAIPSDKFDKVELKPRQTYTFFGFRFSYDDADLYSDDNTVLR